MIITPKTDNERLLKDAERALDRIKDARYERRKQLTEAMERQLDAEFDLRVTIATAEVAAAQATVDAERIQLSEQKNASGYAPGTTLYQWGWISGGFKRRMALTGLKGLVEIWKRGAPAPDNRSSIPDPGTVVLRIMRKDGTIGKKFMTLESLWSSDEKAVVPREFREGPWLPEGKTPKEKA